MVKKKIYIYFGQKHSAQAEKNGKQLIFDHFRKIVIILVMVNFLEYFIAY
jgi:hypothetical protein